MEGILYWYSSKYTKTVYHIVDIGTYKTLCKLENNKNRYIGNLDSVSESPPMDRRVCKICVSLLK